MGRKIPGKKHRGVKDPAKQHARRLAELETKINAPPKDADEQLVPKSLENIIKLKEAVKSGRIIKTTKKKRKQKHDLICVGKSQNRKPLHPKARPEKVVPIFKQNPKESASQFMFRVNRETQAFINETDFETKYGVQVDRHPETGQIMGVTKSPKDILESLRAKHKNIRKKKKLKEHDGTPKLTKVQKRKERLKLKKEKKQQDKDDFEQFKDQVQFGEVVHEPPQLKVRPRKVDLTSSAKPGKKELLLNSLITKDTVRNTNLPKLVSKKTEKLRNLPVGERRQLEKRQSDAIAAYRKLKAQRLTEAIS